MNNDLPFEIVDLGDAKLVTREDVQGPLAEPSDVMPLRRVNP